MMTRFTNLALAAAASLGIAFTPVPAAAADAEDIAKAIAGIAVLGIIAKSVNDRDDRRARQRATVSQQQQRILRQPSDRRVIDGTLRRHNDNFGQHRNFKRVALPNRCVRYLDTNRGTRLVYGRQCLDRRYEHANRLPQHCERLVRTDRGLRTVYGARCLSRDGWQVARR